MKTVEVAVMMAFLAVSVAAPISGCSSGKKHKKGKKGKKKAVELEFDEGLGAVVGRKIHKRGGEDAGNDWE